jgi:hypothetical protein
MLPVSGTALLYLKAPGFYPFAQSDKSNKMNMSMQHWWNNERGKIEFLGEDLSECRFINHKSFMGWTGIEPASL